MPGFALRRRADGFRTAVLTVLGVCLLVLAYAAGALNSPAPPLRCALQIGSL